MIGSLGISGFMEAGRIEASSVQALASTKFAMNSRKNVLINGRNIGLFIGNFGGKWWPNKG
jgi:hypothetical protein